MEAAARAIEEIKKPGQQPRDVMTCRVYQDGHGRICSESLKQERHVAVAAPGRFEKATQKAADAKIMPGLGMV